MASFILQNLIKSLNKKERIVLRILFFIFIISSIFRFIIYIKDSSEIIPIQGGSLKEGLIGQPIYINPIISQNPVDLDLSSLIYSKLKDLTATYETENNFKTHIIVLKENIFWSDGNPITTDDILFTLKLITNEELNSTLENDFKEIKIEKISKIKIKFNLKENSNIFKEKLLNLTILPAHIFDKIPPQNIKLSEYNLQPISSGPYTFKNFKKRKDGFIEEYNLKINEKYHLQKPYIKNITFKFFENETQLIQDLKIKQIDTFFTTPTNKLITLIQNNQKLEKKVIPSNLNYVIIFNPANNPNLKNQETRLALNYAINKEEIIDNLFKNSLKFNIKDFESDFALNYDFKKAQEKIKNIKELNLTFIVDKNDDLTLKIIEIIKNNWNQLNPLINTEIVLLDKEEYQERIKNKNFEAIILPLKIEKENFYQLWHSDYKNQSIINYENKKINQYLDYLKTASKVEEEKILIENIKNMIQQESYFVFLFKLPYYYIYNKKINNIEINLINNPADRFLNIKDWYILKARKIK